MPSLPALLSRLDRFDKSLTDEECAIAVAGFNSDQQSAGMEYASEKAKAITKVHPRADVDDPHAYGMAITAIMSEYPRGVLDRVADPRTGIVRRIKFLPRPAEIAEACDAEMKRRASLRGTAIMIMWERRRRSPNDFASYKSISEKL
jgi:hypothetical protein